MTNVLNPEEFTSDVANRISNLDGLKVETPQPLELEVTYGADEPTLTLKLSHLYEEYKQEPVMLSVLVLPLLTEMGWTVNGTRYAFTDISEHSFQMMRDLARTPFNDDELSFPPDQSKAPLVYQELVA